MPRDKLFDPVEFKSPKDETNTPKPREVGLPEGVPAFDKLQPVITNFKREIVRLQDGSSTLRKDGGVYFPKGKVLPMDRIRAFEGDPTVKMLQEFFRVVKQDFGNRVHDVFLDWMRDVWADVPVRKDDE